MTSNKSDCKSLSKKHPNYININEYMKKDVAKKLFHGFFWVV